MMRGVKGEGCLAAFVALAVSLAGCGGGSTPTGVPGPPTIEAVGIATDVRIYDDHIRYAFADGSIHEVPLIYRQIGDGGLGVVIIGSDSSGHFVAAFPTQAGLPADCYRENRRGIERGPYIETQGVLWAKAPGFTSAVHPQPGTAYPAGSRFCFNEQGRITTVIGN